MGGDPADNAIEVQDLHKTHPGGVKALRGLSFTVAAGEVFALLGPNGAGKSSTVRILTTLSAPTRGRARVAGFDVVEQPQEVRRRIGYVAQTSGVDPLTTGRENLELQCRIFRLPTDEARRRIDEILNLLQLEEVAERLVKTYSGGMQRRLDIAMGLIPQPEVLFLDEPTTGLDPHSRAVMWQEIQRFAGQGLAILLTTHYLEEADKLADRLMIIDRGQVITEGSPDELKGRLRGDVVTIELEDAERVEEAREQVNRVEGIHRVLVDGSELFAQTAHGASAVPAVAATLEKAGISMVQISLSRPSLDDVYLNATGHAFRSAGGPAEASS
ncbi:MAG: ATP-binding cassette domain-containing protein [Acidobacteriota bacterium]